MFGQGKKNGYQTFDKNTLHRFFLEMFSEKYDSKQNLYVILEQSNGYQMMRHMFLYDNYSWLYPIYDLGKKSGTLTDRNLV